MLRRLLVFFLLAGFAVSALAQVQPPDTGKMSWDLFQTVGLGQRTRAAKAEVQTVSVLLITETPVTEEDIFVLQELGYTVLSAFGNFVLVDAPADQYADSERGIDVIDFVSNAALPPALILSNNIGFTNAMPAWNSDVQTADQYQLNTGPIPNLGFHLTE
jgi:hypothetical protein